MKTRSMVLVLLFGLAATFGAGNTAWSEEVELQADGAGLIWSFDRPNGGVRVTIAGEGRSVERDFDAGASIRLGLVDETGVALPDGLYRWEVSTRPVQAHSRDSAAAAGPAGIRASGSFAIRGGSPVLAGGPEPTPATPEPLDQVFIDDVIIQASSCIGFACVNGEAFGFDTLRLKEVNLRLDFNDTSIGGFPGNDWRILINDDTDMGVDNYFAVEDRSAGRRVFSIGAGAPADSLTVDPSGLLGLGTATPVREIHSIDGDTPTLRLEQDGSGSFDPYRWDVGGNEVNFFVRDVEADDIVFKIRPDSPESAWVIGPGGAGSNPGVIGFDPEAPIHINRTDGTARVLVNEASAVAAARSMFELRNVVGNQTIFRLNDGTAGIWDFKVTLGGFLVNEVGDPNEMVVDRNGNVTATSFIPTSSRTRKRDFEPIDRREILARLAELPISEWSFDEEPGTRHIGPFAEDFHAAFGLNGDDPTHFNLTDTQGVALAAIQALNEVVAERDAEIRELRERLTALERLVEKSRNP